MSTFEIRIELHEIIKELLENNSTNIMICREPSRERYRHHHIKAIAVVEDEASAELLIKQINKEVERANVQLKRISELVNPISYKINVIHANDTVTVSKKIAQRRYAISGKQLKIELKAYDDYLNADTARQSFEREKIAKNSKLISQIKDRSLYICARYSGMRYYVGYYDEERKKRHHVSVGDILIIIGKNVTVSDMPTRKERSDKSVSIGHFIKEKDGMEKYYEIYNYDMRFINRRNSHSKKRSV